MAKTKKSFFKKRRDTRGISSSFHRSFPPHLSFITPFLNPPLVHYMHLYFSISTPPPLRFFKPFLLKSFILHFPPPPPLLFYFFLLLSLSLSYSCSPLQASTLKTAAVGLATISLLYLLIVPSPSTSAPKDEISYGIMLDAGYASLFFPFLSFPSFFLLL